MPRHLRLNIRCKSKSALNLPVVRPQPEQALNPEIATHVGFVWLGDENWIQESLLAYHLRFRGWGPTSENLTFPLPRNWKELSVAISASSSACGAESNLTRSLRPAFNNSLRGDGQKCQNSWQGQWLSAASAQSRGPRDFSTRWCE